MTENTYPDISGEWRGRNPKMVGSGLVACRPQVGKCKGGCADCYFNRPDAYYEDIRMPHIPEPDWVNRNGYIIRFNDGNDSNYDRDTIIKSARAYNHCFFNTRLPRIDFDGEGPVVLTVNGDTALTSTNDNAYLLKGNLSNLMSVRIRANTWNLDLAREVIQHYNAFGIPVKITFMRYYDVNKVKILDDYEKREHISNTYWCLKDDRRVELENALGVDGGLIHTCGTREASYCRDCNMCENDYTRWETNQ